MRKQGYTCPWNHKALSHEPSTKYKESQEEGAPKSSQRRQRKEAFLNKEMLALSINRILVSRAVKEKNKYVATDERGNSRCVRALK